MDDNERKEAAEFQRARRAAERERRRALEDTDRARRGEAQRLREAEARAEQESQRRQEAEQRFHAGERARQDKARAAEERERLLEHARQEAEERVRAAEERKRLARQGAERDRLARQEAEREAERERLARQEAEERTRKVERFAAGTYYVKLKQKWDSQNMTFELAHFYALCRENCPRVYNTIFQNAINFNNFVTNASRESHSNSVIRRRFWPTDVFGRRNFGQIAHLIPTSTSHASVYDDVATWALGLTRANLAANNDEEFWAAKQRAIHGVMSGENGKSRIAETGLRHSRFNKIRLIIEDEIFDEKACLLIVPIMSLEAVRNWNGQGYEAIVLPEVDVGNEIEIDCICSAVGMSKIPQDIDATIASDDQVDEARVLLESVLRGLAYSLVHNNRPPTVDAEVAAILTRSRNIVSDIGGVTVPLDAGNRNNPEDRPVRKISFGDDGDETRHMAPDPLLLAVKAAVSWSKRHGQQLLVAGERPDEDIDSLSLLEEEMHAERIDQACRPETSEDLAAGLGQSNGFQGTTVDSHR